MIFSDACERNKGPILDVLKQVVLDSDRRLLEIGSGSGQHAIYIAPNFPKLEWFPTELPLAILDLNKNISKAKIKNIQKAIRLDVSKDDFPKLKFDIVFTANTFHIMHWKDCKSFMKLLGNRLREGSRAIFYGPFKYNNNFTSESNEVFDSQLKQQDPQSGIRNFEDINKNMLKNGFILVNDNEMPANNRMLVYSRLKFEK